MYIHTHVYTHTHTHTHTHISRIHVDIVIEEIYLKYRRIYKKKT